MSSESLQIPSLAQETRTNLDTATAAYHMNRRPQTMRSWACLENGPIRPIRINGRLAWPVSELRRVLGCSTIANHRKGEGSGIDQGLPICQIDNRGSLQ